MQREARSSSSADAGRLCVCVPTYDEAENVGPVVRALLETFEAAALDGTVLVIDDASPDGTGVIADELAAADERVCVLHRAEKNGLGRAYQAGFAWALAHGYESVAQMGCDFSHDPGALPALVAATRDSDVAIGSRYIDGGAIVDRPLARRLISRAGSLYARTLLRLPVRDLTSGFKCIRTAALDSIDSSSLDAGDYGFQIELTQRAAAAGLRVREVPVSFRERPDARSKMSWLVAVEAALLVVQLGLRARYTHLIAAAAATGLVALAIAHPLGTLETLLALLFVQLTACGVATLSWMLYAWRDAESLEATAFPPAGKQSWLSFSIIIPARREEKVLGATLRQLARQDYPSFDVVVVVGDDDPGTRRVARRTIRKDRRFRIVRDDHVEKNKPRALNTALPYCQGDVVGVFDAEDVVAAGLLRSVDAAFEQSGADIVQGATQLMNHHSSWFSARNVLEYYFWFKSRLHFHSHIGFVPLGGNTVFVRREWLEAAGGWDETCLAEDCELGARLSTRGARALVAYSPELVTREETPETVAALIRQRTRWSQGFLQVLRKGDWRTLPWRARALAIYTLSFPFLQAAMVLLLPALIVAAIVLQLPVELAMLSFLPIAPLAAILVVEIVGLESMRAEFGLRVRLSDHLRLIGSAIPYQLILSLAAARAVWRELRGIRNWEKTAHVGAHL